MLFAWLVLTTSCLWAAAIWALCNTFRSYFRYSQTCLSTVANKINTVCAFQSVDDHPGAKKSHIKTCALVSVLTTSALCLNWIEWVQNNWIKYSVGTHIWELIYKLLKSKFYFHSRKQRRWCVFYMCVWEQPTFSSSVNSFSDTGEVGLFFMKSLKLLDRCRESCKHKQKTQFLLSRKVYSYWNLAPSVTQIRYEQHLKWRYMDGWVDGPEAWKSILLAVQVLSKSNKDDCFYAFLHPNHQMPLNPPHLTSSHLTSSLRKKKKK